jgi:hypothetical protein
MIRTFREKRGQVINGIYYCAMNSIWIKIIAKAIHDLNSREEKKRKSCFQNIIPVCVSPPCCGTFDVPPHYLPTDQQRL